MVALPFDSTRRSNRHVCVVRLSENYTCGRFENQTLNGRYKHIKDTRCMFEERIEAYLSREFGGPKKSRCGC